MSSFIGSKISLISKAGIRYEGILYTIDPKESTVALSKVKSFGTEDRKSERVIQARDEVYEFIIFRGSDIQDLNVYGRSKESTLLLEDSAIVRAETSISDNIPPTVFVGGNHAADAAPGVVRDDNSAVKMTSKLTNNSAKDHQRISDISNKEERDAGNNYWSNDSKKQRTKNNGRHGTVHCESQYKHRNVRQEVPLEYDTKYHNNNYHYESEYHHRGQNYRDSYDYTANEGNNNNYWNPPDRYHRYDQYYTNENHNLRGFQSSEYGRDYSYSQYYDYNTPRSSQGHYFNDGNTNKSRRRNNNSEISKQKAAVFKEDYDFETANAIIAKELAIMDVSQGREDLIDDGNNNKDSVREDGEGSEELDGSYYDKNKSFFDKISSEMIDRAHGNLFRSNNRKVNVETFGVVGKGRNISGKSSGRWSGSDSSTWNNGPRQAHRNYTGGRPMVVADGPDNVY